MEQIILEVENSVAKKWEHASAGLKKQATQAVEQLILDEAADDDSEKVKKLEEAKAYFNSLSVDLSGYTFNRDEANER